MCDKRARFPFTTRPASGLAALRGKVERKRGASTLSSERRRHSGVHQTKGKRIRHCGTLSDEPASRRGTWVRSGTRCVHCVARPPKRCTNTAPTRCPPRHSVGACSAGKSRPLSGAGGLRARGVLVKPGLVSRAGARPCLLSSSCSPPRPRGPARAPGATLGLPSLPLAPPAGQRGGF